MVLHRKLKKGIKYSLFFIGAFSIAALVLFYFFTPETPDQALKSAREKLSEARHAQAFQYAPEKFKEASMYYDSAMAAWQSQNRRFILFRDYSKTILFAGKSQSASIEAIGIASRNATNAYRETAKKYQQLEEKLQNLEKLYSTLPLPETFRVNCSRAKLMLGEAKVAREKDQFSKAADILGKASVLLDKAEVLAEKRMKEYFEQYHQWETIYKNAVNNSEKNNSSLIVVEKLAGELRVYKDGKLKHTFKAEFGPNWLGDKNHQGDQATPEGSYLVTRKKEKRQTIYYKALLLNYPNSDDLQRYKQNVKKGVIPKHIDVGGLIEIHGHGGQGFNWTNGCVALSDRDMDVVFRLASVNTPVIIVGSLKTYDEWQALMLSEKTLKNN